MNKPLGMAAAALACTLLVAATPRTARAADLYANSPWSAMASDRSASRIGDTLMIIVYENSLASNSTQISSKKSGSLTGKIERSRRNDISGDISAGGAFEGGGAVGRSGKMLAQLSVVVDQVYPNGDMHVAGQQLLKVNGERTIIRLSGRVRAIDIQDNAVVSSRLSDVSIDYDGAGLVARSGRPGFLTKFISWLGVL